MNLEWNEVKRLNLCRSRNLNHIKIHYAEESEKSFHKNLGDKHSTLLKESWFSARGLIYKTYIS